MKEAVTTSDALLQRLSDQRRQRLRKNVQLLFLGLSSEETDPIISLLRGARLAPRGRQISTEEELLQALSERSWDLIICTAERDNVPLKTSLNHLKRLDRDIPVIQLVPLADSRLLLEGLKANMQAVVPLDEKELLLITIKRELENLENRRRMRQAEASIVEAEKRCRVLMEHSQLAIAYFDAERLLLANSAFASLFGYEMAEKLEGKPIEQFVIPQDKDELYEQVRLFAEDNLKELLFQLTARRADDSNFTAHIELQESQYNGCPCVQVTIRAELKELNRKAFSDTDPITGLYNAHFLHSKLDRTIQLALDGGHDCNLIYIHIINNDQIRASYGSDTCDYIAREIADILRSNLIQVHLKARHNESDYAIIFQDPSAEKAIFIAEQLHQLLSGHHFVFNEFTVSITLSIGISTINDTSPVTNELLKRAQTAALAAAKINNNAPAVQLFTLNQNNCEPDYTKQIAALKKAVANEQFKLLYQPIVPLSYNSNISHYEVLLRLLDSKQNQLPPSLFLNTMEMAELSVTMDRWVIQHCIAELQKELIKGAKHRLFISVTNRTWKDAGFLQWLSEQLMTYRIPADHLVFQLSETDCSSNLEAAKQFSEGLKQLRCLICIKHHGSSSNAALILKQVSADYVKIDGSFVHDLSNKSSIDNSFNEMLEELKSQGKITIAPLVEDPKVMSRLWKSGIGLIQGYYLQPPGERMDYDFFEGN